MFFSILFPAQEHYQKTGQSDVPACFKDPNLDQIFAPILEANKEFELEKFFYAPLDDPGTIVYRQDVMRELESIELRTVLAEFSTTVYNLGRSMGTIREALASNKTWENNYLSKGHMLDYAEQYCRAVSELSQGLSKMTFRSAGLRGLAGYLSAYGASEDFSALFACVKRLRMALAGIEYCMLIKNGTVRVRKLEGQDDYSAQILATFEKFREGDVKDYRRKLSEEPHAVHVEAAVLDMVAKLYPEIFDDIDSFCSKNLDFVDETILRFSQEIRFYLSWLDHIRPLQSGGLPFNYPKVHTTPQHLFCKNGFDLALAAIVKDKIVPNDFTLNAPEHVIAVTGPN